jgi:hypothetical protein
VPIRDRALHHGCHRASPRRPARFHHDWRCERHLERRDRQFVRRFSPVAPSVASSGDARVDDCERSPGSARSTFRDFAILTSHDPSNGPFNKIPGCNELARDAMHIVEGCHTTVRERSVSSFQGVRSVALAALGRRGMTRLARATDARALSGNWRDRAKSLER